jgi:uncharacterized protein YcbX
MDTAAIAALQAAIGRPVSLSHIGSRRSSAASGGFFDAEPIHLLTTATMNEIARRNPASRIDPRRFRPNIVIDTGDAEGFVEEDWIGRTLALGDTVLLQVTSPCERCVMTTLAQDDLPADPSVLRTLSMVNEAVAGVYARVVRGGMVQVGAKLTWAQS